MDLKGNLEVFEPIFVFQILNIAMATGELNLKCSDNVASVYFDRGRVTFAAISNRPVRLGEYLVREGYISRDQLEESLRKKTKRKRLGVILIEDNVIDEEVLKRAIEDQIKEVIYEVVKWNEGSFTFNYGRKPSSQDIFIDIPLESLMLEGLKRLDEAGGDNTG